MARILNEQPRDFIEQRRDGNSLILRNPRTNAEVTLPKSASSHEKRMAIKQLQESVDDPFAGVKAAEGLDRMAGVQPKAAAGDPEPRRPLQGVGRDTPFRRKQEAEWQAWRQRQDAKATRQRELADIDRLADAVADKIKTEQPTPAPAGDDGSQYLPPWAQSFDDFKAQAFSEPQEPSE